MCCHSLGVKADAPFDYEIDAMLLRANRPKISKELEAQLKADEEAWKKAKPERDAAAAAKSELQQNGNDSGGQNRASPPANSGGGGLIRQCKYRITCTTLRHDAPKTSRLTYK